MKILQIIGGFLYAIRWLIVGVLAIGLPIYLYLIFAKEPVFGPEDDVELGKMSAQSLAEDPEEYPILPESEYPEAYEHLRRIVGGVIGSPEIQYRDVFAYDQMKIINRDDVLNAFCTPGGYIYVYTGLIKYLDREDHLAGVLGHEIAHAEKRHGSVRLQKEYGAKALTNFLLLTVPISAGDYINAKRPHGTFVQSRSGGPGRRVLGPLPFDERLRVRRNRRILHQAQGDRGRRRNSRDPQ